MKRQRGMALLLTLWLIALLATLLAGLAATVQLQLRQAAYQRDHAQGQLAARAGLSLAVAGLLAADLKARWRADGQPHRLVFAGSQLAIAVHSERGKLDLNAGAPDDLARLLGDCGAPAATALAVGQALGQRQRSDQPLGLLEEFRALPGMTYALYQCAAPYLTVWSGDVRPDPALAAPRLAQVLGLPRVHGAALDPGQLVTVTSQVTLADGYRTDLSVTLTLNPPGAGARPYRVLRWQE